MDGCMYFPFQKWTGLRFSPKCWSVMQPLLCSLYLPECVGGQVDLIPKQKCTKVREQCRIIDTVIESGLLAGLEWPTFMNCSNTDIYSTPSIAAPHKAGHIFETRSGP